MHSKYKVLKFSSNSFDDIEDLVSIEEPLEISLKFKNQDQWVTQNLSITMRTPGHDEDLVRGFLFNEQIVKNISHIDTIESYGEKVGQYNIQNKILATLNNSQNINISKIKRDFLTNSSCGVCGKSSLDALEIIKKDKTNSTEPRISKEVIIQAPNLLRENQSEFSKTGGIHASGLFDNNGNLIEVREDIGRHNAVDKCVGSLLLKDHLKNGMYLLVSGRVSYEIVSKAFLAKIQVIVAVSACSSMAVDFAKEFGICLIGFTRENKMTIYANPSFLQTKV